MLSRMAETDFINKIVESGSVKMSGNGRILLPHSEATVSMILHGSKSLQIPTEIYVLHIIKIIKLGHCTALVLDHLIQHPSPPPSLEN
jgi:hypothetical protein